MNIIDSLNWRYATKKFDTSKKLTSTQLDLLKQAFNLTATSFGLQPIKLVIISNQKLKEKLVPLCFNQKQVAQASHVLVICIEKETTSNDINAYFDLEKEIRGTKEEVISKFRNQLVEMYKNKTKKEIETSAKYQAYIALGNLMTVCAVQKIDACPFEGFIPEKVDELLKLNELKLKSVLLLPVGFRAEDDLLSSLKKVRKPLNKTVIEIN